MFWVKYYPHKTVVDNEFRRINYVIFMGRKHTLALRFRVYTNLIFMPLIHVLFLCVVRSRSPIGLPILRTFAFFFRPICHYKYDLNRKFNLRKTLASFYVHISLSRTEYNTESNTNRSRIPYTPESSILSTKALFETIMAAVLFFIFITINYTSFVSINVRLFRLFGRSDFFDPTMVL